MQTMTTTEVSAALGISRQDLNRRPHRIPPLRVGKPGRGGSESLWDGEYIMRLAALRRVGVTLGAALEIAPRTEIVGDGVLIRSQDQPPFPCYRGKGVDQLTPEERVAAKRHAENIVADSDVFALCRPLAKNAVALLGALR